VCGNGDDTVLAACDKKALIVPVAGTDSFGVFSHGGDFSFVFLEIKVQVAFLIAKGKHWVGFGPFEPCDFALLVLELEFF
jgi:hypothetical protein